MVYNKKERLRANIDAIKTVFMLDKEGREPTPMEAGVILKQYAGFGGLKCVLNPANSLADTAYWAKSELELFPLVAELHRVLKENTANEYEYKRYVNSIKNSVLTAFYTPKEIVDVLANALSDSGITPSRILDPSAGMGEFANAFQQQSVEEKNVFAFEKDLLTGKMLSPLSPDTKVNIEGFETIENRYNNYFDVVSSNIPFGDMNVFDAAFMKQDQLHKDSTHAIHNYFFIKGVETLREGGILAFITSQGVMNSPNNTPIREWLMQNTNLVSAIRLPNNLFTDYAGTEVGSDLIILQKNTGKDSKLSFWENLFVGTSQSELTGIYTNDYFYNHGRVVLTKATIGTDPYGKPAQVFIHEGGIEGMAADMRKMLESDFKSYLNLDLYNGRAVIQKQPESKAAILFNEEVKNEIVENNLETSGQDKSTYPDDLDPFWQAVENHWFPNEKESLNKEEENIRKVQPPENTSDAVSRNTLFDDKPQSVTQEALEIDVSSQPVMSLYDLFGFTQEERSQVKPVRGGKKKAVPPKGKPVQLSMFSSNGQAPPNNNKAAYPVSDARKDEQQEALRQEEKKLSFEPRPYSGELKEFHKKGSLVAEKNGQIGFLSERYKNDAVFQPLALSSSECGKIRRYVNVRDAYHELYNYEAVNLQIGSELREQLNLKYHFFVSNYGNLNDKKNLDVIKMDAGGKEILSIERAIDEKRQKADIFHGPVAFNPNELKVAGTSDEALIASLNKYGEVRLDYMESLMTDKSREDMIAELHGRIYFNPLIQNYEVQDRFIAGNVVEKAEAVERYLQNHPDDLPAQESLKALQEATPEPIRYEQLDFNFGERWIDISLYEDYVSKLFEADVTIDYYVARDDFTVKADKSNLIINEKFAVQGESKLYTGMHLLKHALLNTTPNITKTITVSDPETGELRDVKVPDGQAIQMANTKIDEIRNGFSDWLDQQSPEFKNDLADRYNRRFNCFVSPQYDGSHQSFPGLDLKALGIPDLYL